MSKRSLLQKASFIILFFLIVSCSKKEDALSYAKQMLAGKTWYLTYTILNNQTKSYINASTYSIQFKEQQKTFDSDGISGTYQVIEQNQHLQLIVQGATQTGIPANYLYQIDQIESNTLKISYNQNGLFIQKIFTTTH